MKLPKLNELTLSQIEFILERAKKRDCHKSISCAGCPLHDGSGMDNCFKSACRIRDEYTHRLIEQILLEDECVS